MVILTLLCSLACCEPLDYIIHTILRMRTLKVAGSVAANIDDWYVVSERCYFFLQLQIDPTDLFIVVPRNYAIFPKLHTNR